MDGVILPFIRLMVLLLQAYIVAVVVRCVAGWMNRFPPRSGPLSLLYRITDPYLNMFSTLFPFLNLGHLDFSPIIGILVLEVLIRIFLHAAAIAG